MASALAKLRKRLDFSSPIKEKSGKTRASSGSSLPGELCRQFSLDEIKTATFDFNKGQIIGKGGFGDLYKGFIDEGNSRPVAMNRYNPTESNQGAEQFKKDALFLCQIRHVNLIPLIGYCNDEGELILVYDFMANNTIHHQLHGTDKAPLLWKQRLQICIGAARGLHYLHTGLKHKVIHGDVNTSNILLDDKLIAKVSNFRFSTHIKFRNRNLTVDEEVTCGPLDQEYIEVSTITGTFGYVAPEYALYGHLSEKTDVYSFGVVLLEVLCAREAVEFKLEKEQRVLTLWARECIKKGSIYRIIDPYLKGKIAPECFKVYEEIAMTCLQDPAIHRPTMVDVVDKLELALELQEKADAERFEINEGGFQFLDEEEKAFLNPCSFKIKEGGRFQFLGEDM